MAELKDLSITDANNNGSAANAGFAENMNYSAVNNAARALEGMLARWFADNNGTLTTGGSANAYTLTPNRTVSAYTDGDVYLIEANHTNTGAATLNVSSLGAKSIVTPSAAALAANDIISGGRYLVSYDGTNFQLIAAIPDGAITNARIRDSAALSVVGRSANSTGDVADISATATSGAVLRESGSTIGFGTIATAGIADDAVTYAKIQDVSATSRVLGRVTAGAGVIEELDGTALTALLDASTTGAVGVVELATTAETKAGTDTARAVTAAAIAGSKSLASSGYYTLPGGFTVQWGGSDSTTSVGNNAVSFPTTFTSVYRVVACPRMTTAVANAFGINTESTTGFNFYTNAALAGYRWVAFGHIS